MVINTKFFPGMKGRVSVEGVAHPAVIRGMRTSTRQRTAPGSIGCVTEIFYDIQYGVAGEVKDITVTEAAGLFLPTPESKDFKVVCASANRNAFGLTGMILVAQDGECWQVAANSLNIRKRDEIIQVRLDADGNPMFSSLGYEIPEKQPAAPVDVTRLVWGEEAR